MRFAGRITEWHDEKGYGFITPNGGGDRVFVHVRAISRAGPRPGPGLQLTYQVERDGRGRMNAVSARPAGRDKPAARGGRSPKGVLALACLAMLVAATAWLGMPALVPAGYAAMSAITFIAYAIDKRAAQAGHRRTPESTLHLMALAGGWPGAMAAQHWLRHKSVKASFLVVYRTTVLLNLGALAAWIFEHRA
ncbi:DUF1294 domain-containing protein [Arenimonas metalli]|uniref:CSD domain-containing protein n=1 Tax=Arenimonas metalli CF5-1 TaxID=1384056 RepID=A0A091B767_9GAMM|nr:cold shock and DUF1294 domain-containing protein [Arenimonas metalli]KFN47576.1 hypothetical protein N787_08425 [Arenimonas metalli CF5-1]